MAYIFEGSYCGDFELNPDTFHQSYANKDFTDVIKKWDPNTFFKLPFKDCNPLFPEGSDVTLPECEDYPIIGPPLPPPPVPPYVQSPNPPTYESEAECIERPELCNSPCHHKFLDYDGDCPKW